MKKLYDNDLLNSNDIDLYIKELVLNMPTWYRKHLMNIKIKMQDNLNEMYQNENNIKHWKTKAKNIYNCNVNLYMMNYCELELLISFERLVFIGENRELLFYKNWSEKKYKQEWEKAKNIIS